MNLFFFCLSVSCSEEAFIGEFHGISDGVKENMYENISYHTYEL